MENGRTYAFVFVWLVVTFEALPIRRKAFIAVLILFPAALAPLAVGNILNTAIFVQFKTARGAIFLIRVELVDLINRNSLRAALP